MKQLVKFIPHCRLLGFGLLAAFGLAGIAYIVGVNGRELIQLKSEVAQLQVSKAELESSVASLSANLTSVKSEDQYVTNRALEKEIANINKTYILSKTVYEHLLDLKDVSKKTDQFDSSYASVLTLLANRNYASASATLTALDSAIKTEQDKVSASVVIPQNVPVNNAPPGSGFQRQSVAVEGLGNYMVDIVAADMGSTRVIVDTASEGDCRNDCPVLALGDYVARNGAFAGVNGSYFCPATYPTCSDRKNSFDTLLMNKNKKYFNSDNNVYSTVPAVIFGNGWMRFIGQSLEWGRDTSIDSMLANQSLLVSGQQVVFGGDGDPKKGSKGSRSFVANKGSIAYIGVVHNTTVAEAARVLKSLGVDNALNLDSGGSTALWSGGYKVGPGRGIPNAILFVRK